MCFCSQNIRSLLPLEKVINTFADQVLLSVLIEDFTLSLNNTINQLYFNLNNKVYVFHPSQSPLIKRRYGMLHVMCFIVYQAKIRHTGLETATDMLTFATNISLSATRSSG